jgi:hypothetical protein
MIWGQKHNQHTRTRHQAIGGSQLTRDEEEAGFELLEEHHSLPHEATSEQDKHGPGSDGRPAQTNGQFESNPRADEHEHHAGCRLKERWGGVGGGGRHLSLVGLGLRVLGARGLTSSAG